MKPRILCLLAPGFEELEAVAPIDLLRRAEGEVVTASVNGDPFVTGRSGITLKADAALAEVNPAEFDLLVLPGGPGVRGLREDGRAARLAREFFFSGKFVAAICAAPAILGDAGLLEGARFTAHDSIRDEWPAALADERVVRDGQLITSRGAGTAIDFGLALVAVLCGPEPSAAIASSILA